MVNVRPSSPPDRRSRFNVLLTEDDRPRPTEHWLNQLPRLLEPQGVAAYVARCGQEAVDLAGRIEIHAAVIDLATPRNRGESPTQPDFAAVTPSTPPTGSTSGTSGGGGGGGSGGGLWLLELFRRMPHRPPVVVINQRIHSQREVDRFLHEALRLGAFTVLNRPIGLEQLLTVFRRVLDRQYHGNWPDASNS
jgi:DNA-binding response OmpR family regulator